MVCTWQELEPMKRLKTLLGPKPTHPWAALIPQILVWSFRRFCVEKLLTITDLLLLEQVWEDHFELIRDYAPKGLNVVAKGWLVPENTQHLHSSLEEYNAFFMDCLEVMDYAIAEDDELTQNYVSVFLDLEIKEIFNKWLVGEERVFLIFPMKQEDDNVFTEKQVLGLIQNLISYSKNFQKEVKAEPEAPVVQPEAPTEAPTEAPVVEPEAPVPPPTIAEAIKKRRHTYRCNGRRANRGPNVRSRAKTTRRVQRPNDASAPTS